MLLGILEPEELPTGGGRGGREFINLEEFHGVDLGAERPPAAPFEEEGA